MSEFWSKIKTDEGEETIPLFTILRILQNMSMGRH